jgi:putative ATPase
MKGLGYGRGYKYAHEYAGGIAPDQTYLPERLSGHRYYVPRNLGKEGELGERSDKSARPEALEGRGLE